MSSQAPDLMLLLWGLAWLSHDLRGGYSKLCVTPGVRAETAKTHDTNCLGAVR